MNKLALLFLIIINFGCAQNKSEDIKLEDLQTTFYEFQKLNEDKNYDKAFDYYYDGFLKIVPKSELLNDLSKLNNNPNYEYLVKNSKIISISKIVEKNNIKYALIKFRVNTQIKFNDSSDLEMIELIKENAQNLYENTYSYSESKKEITFSKDDEMIAITDNGWKFFAFSDKIKLLIKTLLPKDILNEILSKKFN